MKDIYSPLEIDEEWDNFSPAEATTMAPDTAPAPGMKVPVTGEAPAVGMGVDMDGSDPARAAAEAAITSEAGASDTTVADDNFKKWNANANGKGTATAESPTATITIGGEKDNADTAMPAARFVAGPDEITDTNQEPAVSNPEGGEIGKDNPNAVPIDVRGAAEDEGTDSQYGFDNTNTVTKDSSDFENPAGDVGPTTPTSPGVLLAKNPDFVDPWKDAAEGKLGNGEPINPVTALEEYRRGQEEAKERLRRDQEKAKERLRGKAEALAKQVENLKREADDKNAAYNDAKKALAEINAALGDDQEELAA